MSTPGDYYDRCRREAATIAAKLEAAKKDGADYETILRLEKQLEQARYTGD